MLSNKLVVDILQSKNIIDSQSVLNTSYNFFLIKVSKLIFMLVSFDYLFLVCIAVTNYNTVVETNSDSDDEDKLHIVEEESITDAADCEGGVPEDDLPADQTVLPGSSAREGSAKSCWEDNGEFGSSRNGLFSVFF